MEKEDYRKVIESGYNRESWQKLLYDIFHSKINFRANPIKEDSSSDIVKDAFFLGKINLSDNRSLGIYEVELGTYVDIERSRVQIRNLLINNWHNQGFDGAFIFCFKKNQSVLRFSYVSEFGEITENGDWVEHKTDTKRYTYYLGEGHRCRTAIDEFIKLKNSGLTLNDVTRAFSIEALSDRFFNGYRELYSDIITYITGKKMEKISGKWTEKIVGRPNSEIIKEFREFEDPEKSIRDYVKKLLGRLVFLQFLQKKGWLGVPKNHPWGDGDKEYTQTLWRQSHNQDDFVDSVLEVLFNDLNEERGKDALASSALLGNNVRIPYLNGGLFERDKQDETNFSLPKKFFDKIFDFFSEYNFTIDENDPDDAEIGIDPEMLGKIFENLLEDNKDKGAFYTPKGIVKYMCQESLISYLKTNTEIEEEKLRLFVQSPYENNNFSQHDKNLLIRYLKRVKICDPAIGSGAFPMGLLNILYSCRIALDSDDSGANIKEQIIQNSIYGVDIDKGAVDIARLRFWLALMVDETQPRPLPNLDYKIMQGDSLLESYEGFDMSNILNSDDMFVQHAADGLKEKEEEFFSTHDINEKQNLRHQINEIIKRCISASNQNAASIDIPNSKFFLWHTWFAKVFEEGGFDILIGNPPYIQLQNNGGRLANLYKGANYKTFARTGDIYCLFFERGWNLLKQGAHLCFITSNKWMRAGYGEETRNFLAQESNPLQLIDFGGVKIFDTATVDTDIILLQKSSNKGKTKACSVRDVGCVNNVSEYLTRDRAFHQYTSKDSWTILSPIELAIKKKIESAGTPLKDWNIKIYRGILTGYNDAFIITSEQRAEIIQNCKSTAERDATELVIRPILRGRDIKRYSYNYSDLYLIATFPSMHYDIENYPAIKQHLLKFDKRRLEQTGNRYAENGEIIIARKKTNNKWFETQDSISYWEEFSKQKIMYSEIVSGPQFYLDSTGYFLPEATTFIITGDHLDYLYKILNSQIITNIFKRYYAGGGLGLNGYRYKKAFLERLPIVKYTDSQLQKEICTCTNDDNVEEMIAALFGLAKEEIKVMQDYSL